MSYHLSHLKFFIQALTTLNLCNNQIGLIGAEHLGAALINNTVVLILKSSISYIDQTFSTQTLTILDLSYNHIGASEAQHLGDALQKNTVILILLSSISYSFEIFDTDTHHNTSRQQSYRKRRSTVFG